MSEKSIQVTVDGEIAIVRLCRGTTNAIGPDLIAELTQALRRLAEDLDVRGVVLASGNDKFFSIGLDIPYLIDLSPAEFAAFYQAFNELCLGLYTLPKPTASAISGHATAGGCILALCCDFRLIAEGRKLIGLNEIKLGVPVPYVADRLLRDAVGAHRARLIMESGEFYTPEGALSFGLVDEVVPMPDLLPRALEQVRAFTALPPGGYAGIKRNRTEVVEHQIRSRLEATSEAFVECWYSPEARERLREAAAKF